MSILRQGKTMGTIGLSLVMALTVIVGLALPALGDDWLPFRGHADEMIIDATPFADGLHVTATGTGQATYLGRFNRLAHVIVHSDGSAEGSVVFTAANGDQLFATIKGEPIPGTTVPTVGGTYTFTGGTGRFSDASGGAYFVAVFAPDGSPTVDFGGIIQY